MKRKNLIKYGLTALASFCALAISTTQAQDKPAFDSSFTLAANDADSSGGTANNAASPGSAGGDDAASQEALARAAQNPIANMISVPLQNNFNFGIGPNDVTQWNLNVEPVIPISLNDDWTLITRTIIPIINQPSPGPGVGNAFGLGDINHQFYLTSAKPHQWILGAGPMLTIPTETSSELGNGKWCAGPDLVVLTIRDHWVVGALVNHQLSFAGWGQQNVNAFLAQPIVNYNLPHGWYLVSTPIITANFEAAGNNAWTVPVGGGIGKIFKIGKQSFNGQLQAFDNVVTPDNGPSWQLRFQISLLFPK
jgi:hypothetical protein